MTDRFEPGGVVLGGVTLSDALTGDILPTGLPSTALFYPPLLIVNDDIFDTEGPFPVFIVPPEPAAFIVTADPAANIVGRG